MQECDNLDSTETNIESGAGAKHVLSVLSILGKLMDRFCVLCIAVFLAVTGVATVFVTAYLPAYTYRIEFSSQSALLVLAASLILVVVFSIPKFSEALDQCDLKRMLNVLMAYSVIVGCFWVALADVWPDWDSLEIEKTASEIGNKESVRFVPDSYISRFSHQVPFMFLIRLFQWLFGSGSYVAFQLVNVFSVALTFYLLVKLAGVLFDNQRVSKGTVLLSFLFLPLMFYCTFEYANLIVLPACTGALVAQAYSIKRRSFRFAVLSAALLFVAVLLKSSMLLFTIAVFVTWVIRFIRKQDVVSLAAAFLVFVSYVSGGWLIAVVASGVLGTDVDNTLPKTAWVALGLRGPNADMPENCGWYDGSLWKWTGEDYKVDAIREENMRSIRDSVQGFVSNPPRAFSFFQKKYCSEWCQPDYESLLASNWAAASPGMPVMAQREMTPLLQSIYYGLVHKVIIDILDCLQSLLVIGSLAALVANRKKPVEFFTALLMCAGTALFYLIWEAQSQYVMHAYVLMVPYASAGLLATSGLVREKVSLLHSWSIRTLS